MNPIEEGLVSKLEHFRLSSASAESPIKILSGMDFGTHALQMRGNMGSFL